MLASNEIARMAAAVLAGATIVDVPTGYASSFDRNMTPAIRQRLYEDGYVAVAQAVKRIKASQPIEGKIELHI
jgi:NTE family protein